MSTTDPVHGQHPPGPTHAPRGSCAAVVGLQWGDEGKGKIVDALMPAYDAVVRYNGGANAGHSVVVAGERYALHLIPSGMLTPGKLAVIGPGVVVEPETLLREIDGLNGRGIDTSSLLVSDRAHVVMPYHMFEDELRERLLSGGSSSAAIGTTKRGIGPCYADKAHRATSIRVGDLLRPAVLRARLERICALKNARLSSGHDVAPGRFGPPFDPAALTDWAAQLGARLQPFITDTVYRLHDLLADGKSLLFEGANATLLDVDHGTYPFVTSSSCSVLGIPAGTGVPPRLIQRVVGVVKAYSTRVGAGPMPTELQGDLADRIRTRGREFGTTTGRPRRVGWIDLVALRYTAMLNGVTEIALTLLDVLADLDELRICTAYDGPGGQTHRFTPDADALADVRPIYQTVPGFHGDLSSLRDPKDLPEPARAYIRLIERACGAPVTMVGVGPDRAQTIFGREPGRSVLE